MVWLAYFDKPDDDACFQKIWFNVKSTALFGAITSFVDIMLISHPENYYEMLRKVKFWMTPFVAMGATSAAVACGLANIRKKNDLTNFAVGGFVGGSVWGAHYHSLPKGVGFGIVAGTFCVFAKIAHRDNWDNFKINKHRDFGTFRHYDRDYTLRKDPKDHQ